MKTVPFKLASFLKALLTREHGQDLVEYALVVALISFGATAAMKNLASGISTAYTGLSTTLSSYVS